MKPAPSDPGLAERLLAEGLLTPEQLALAESERRRRGGGLLDVVASLAFASPDTLCEFVARVSGSHRADLASSPPRPELLDVLPAPLARRLRVVPVAWADGRLTIATADPFNVVALDLVRQSVGCDVEVVTASEREILGALDRMEATGPSLHESIERSALEVPEPPAASLAAEPNAGPEGPEAPVIALVHQMIERAVGAGASDLHVEPGETSVSLRLRVDGLLRHDVLIPKSLQAAVTSRLKLLGDMDVTETRRPQDGRATVRVDRQPINLRLSTLPTRFGESVVLRILDPTSQGLGLAQLGLPGAMDRTVRNLLATPHGVLLVTGPTGSGKTTTLYALLQELNRPDLGIFTLEDPVELTLPGIRQTQIQEDIGLTFGTALRSLLRQDPDVILVGETRDAETAGLMIRAALTGHLVFSTLHTNDAPGAIPRLLDLGIEPCLIPDSLVAVLAQRLVRRLCLQCRRPVADPGRVTAGHRSSPPNGTALELWQAVGCPACRNTGYRGRQALFELLVPDERFHDAVMRRAPHSEFLRLAREQGMEGLFEDGWRRVLDGTTTLAEVITVTRPPEARP